jgi:hypothetical protein
MKGNKGQGGGMEEVPPFSVVGVLPREGVRRGEEGRGRREREREEGEGGGRGLHTKYFAFQQHVKSNSGANQGSTKKSALQSTEQGPRSGRGGQGRHETKKMINMEDFRKGQTNKRDEG